MSPLEWGGQYDHRQRCQQLLSSRRSGKDQIAATTTVIEALSTATCLFLGGPRMAPRPPPCSKQYYSEEPNDHLAEMWLTAEMDTGDVQVLADNGFPTTPLDQQQSWSANAFFSIAVVHTTTNTGTRLKLPGYAGSGVAITSNVVQPRP